MPVAVATSGSFAIPAGITGAFTSPDMRNTGCVGVKCVMDLAANPGGLGSCVFKIQARDPGSGGYFDLLTSAALTTVATRVFTVCPSIAVSAGVAVRDVLPATWRVTVSGNGNPVTYTVGFTLLP